MMQRSAFRAVLASPRGPQPFDDEEHQRASIPTLKEHG